MNSVPGGRTIFYSLENVRDFPPGLAYWEKWLTNNHAHIFKIHFPPPSTCQAKRQDALFGCADPNILPSMAVFLFYCTTSTVWLGRRVKYENWEDYHLRLVSMMYQPVRPLTPESTTRQGRTSPPLLSDLHQNRWRRLNIRPANE